MNKVLIEADSEEKYWWYKISYRESSFNEAIMRYKKIPIPWFDFDAERLVVFF